MKTKPFLRTAYTYDEDPAYKADGIECKEPSLTVQADAIDADINVIVKRIMQGQPPPLVRAPAYGDFTGISDFQTAMEAVDQARREFMKLPPELRARLNNDPQEFLEFVQDPASRGELERLGLIQPKPAPEAPKEPAVKEKA